MNEEDEVDTNGMPTPEAVRSMAMGIWISYEYYMEARADWDARKIACHADRVRVEMGGLLQAIGKALGDL